MQCVPGPLFPISSIKKRRPGNKARGIRTIAVTKAWFNMTLLIVQISNLHKIVKSWTTSTHPKNHEEITNN